MEKDKLIKQWHAEENHAFQGWDFSHINGRWDEPDPPWCYKEVIKKYLKDTDILLDMGTGGGEFLLTLKHPYKNTYVTEAYEPNFKLCKKTLEPLGITVARTYEDDKLPFENNSFDIIINRHESFDLPEVNRTLKNGGYFITQQVGNMNTVELMQRLNDDFVYHNPAHNMSSYTKTLKETGFQIIKAEECKYPIKVYDVGALVFMAKILEWEYPDFSVKSHLHKLNECQKEIDEKGFLEATGHRFIIVAMKDG